MKMNKIAKEFLDVLENAEQIATMDDCNPDDCGVCAIIDAWSAQYLWTDANNDQITAIEEFVYRFNNEYAHALKYGTYPVDAPEDFDVNLDDDWYMERGYGDAWAANSAAFDALSHWSGEYGHNRRTYVDEMIDAFTNDWQEYL